MKQIVLVILMIVSTSCYASETTKQEKLLELIHVMDMDAMMDTMYAQMAPMMQNTSVQMGVKPEEQAIFDTYYKEMTLVMKKEINWEKMQPMVLEIYSKNFSETEITEMLQFYKSETGQSILKKMPAVMQESMQISQVLMQGAVPKIKEVVQQFTEKLNESRESSE